ncbi:hypothetical protein F4823DRAFT_564461 [Ustulina deusta]|nr:hypothetical protein F4823DRAFT_564461 [Ustulina deusta]
MSDRLPPNFFHPPADFEPSPGKSPLISPYPSAISMPPSPPIELLRLFDLAPRGGGNVPPAQRSSQDPVAQADASFPSDGPDGDRDREPQRRRNRHESTSSPGTRAISDDDDIEMESDDDGYLVITPAARRLRSPARIHLPPFIASELSASVPPQDASEFKICTVPAHCSAVLLPQWRSRHPGAVPAHILCDIVLALNTPSAVLGLRSNIDGRVTGFVFHDAEGRAIVGLLRRAMVRTRGGGGGPRDDSPDEQE